MKQTKHFRRIGALVCALFTVYILLDTFVIERSYAAAGQENLSLFASEADEEQMAGETVLTELSGSAGQEEREEAQCAIALPADAQLVGSAEGSGYALSLYTFRVNATQVYAADVELASAQVLKTALAGDLYGRNITAKTSEIAAGNGAVLAINGDFYGARESGIVIRNGVLYRDSAAKDTEVLVIYADGSFEIVSGDGLRAEALLDAGAWQAFSFGPGLVENGVLSVSANDEVGRSMSSNPRTAIGTLGEGHYVFLVSDGRTGASEGLSLYELAQLMAALGCTQAYNLDGGGSSTMVFQGELVNNPTTNGKRISERSVSDIVYI